MANEIPKTSIFIDKYHPNKQGLCAVSIRITFNCKRKFYSTPITLTLSDFEKTQGNKPRKNFKNIAMKLQSYENKAVGIINSLPVFTWNIFEKYYFTNSAAKSTLKEAYSIYSKNLMATENIGTAYSYDCAQKSLHKFSPDAKFGDVTPDFLKKYEKWMLSQGRSITTVGIYLRTLRRLFNVGINDGIILKELYPFGKNKYEIPTGNNIKKSLTLNEIALIYYYKAEPRSIKQMAKDFWLFIYLCNGINVKDLCLLQYANIQKGDILEFNRAKTVLTKRKVEPIRVILSDDLKAIIKKYGNVKHNSNTYIFKVLKKGLAPVKQRTLIQEFTRIINKHIRIIVEELGIKKDVTTYVARHSFATILKRSGASTEFIGEALGHSNVKTTQNYLAGFEDDYKKETAKALTAFKFPEQIQTAS